jgi:hypothetical protein
MRKIKTHIFPKTKVNILPKKTKKPLFSDKQLKIATTRITFAFAANLIQEIENFIASKIVQGDYTYPSISAIVRQSLLDYQQGKIKLAEERNNKLVKREITIRFPPDLLNFYHSFPMKKRVDVLERCLISYWEKIKKK